MLISRRRRKPFLGLLEYGAESRTAKVRDPCYRCSVSQQEIGADLVTVNNKAYLKVRKIFHMVGLIDTRENPDLDERFHLDEGLFLSKGGRICSYKSAATFESRDEAAALFHKWVSRNPGRSVYKLEVVSYSTMESRPFTLFDESHPLWEIETNEPSATRKIARVWFYDYLHDLNYSKSTIARHQKVLSKYGIDLKQRVDPELSLALRLDQLREESRANEEVQATLPRTDLRLVDAGE